MQRLDVKKLTRAVSADGVRLVYVRPGIAATYYVNAPVDKASRLVADAVQRFLEFIGPDTMRTYLSQNGTYKEFNPKRLQRDLSVMRGADPEAAGPDLDYSSDIDGGVGSYGISVRGSQNDDALYARAVTMMTLGFPDDAIERHGVDQLVEFMCDQAVQLKAQSGNAGWAFRRAPAFESDATKAINAVLPRYTGFDPDYYGFGLFMRGRAPTAHWLNFLDEKLLAGCGGRKTLNQLAPEAVVKSAQGITSIRAARLPPIGDVNRKAMDIGSVPGVSRFMKPQRVQIAGLGDNKLSAATWLARFDEMAPRSWDNA